MNERKPKVLIYVQDSWGLGHIQRASRLARTLEQDADCLILCGHREAGWVVSEGCEYIRIPSLNVPLSKASGGVFWGRRSQLKMPLESAIRVRRELIRSAIDTFAPDVIIVENRPLGMSDELSGILERTDAVKFFLTRGIMTHPSRVRSSFLSEVQEQALRAVFDKIIVVADRRIWDVAREYDLDPEIAAKLQYVGYLSEPVDATQIQRLRAARGVRDDTRWIVCSAGGGALGERLIEEFKVVAATLSNVVIDVIQGPHSLLPWQAPLTSIIEETWGRLHQECRLLPLLHAAADLVVCPGGSSLIEVMEGGAPIITISVQPDKDDDQGLLSSRLAQHYPIAIIKAYENLGPAVAAELGRPLSKAPIRQTRALDFDGLRSARDLILSAARIA